MASSKKYILMPVAPVRSFFVQMEIPYNRIDSKYQAPREKIETSSTGLSKLFGYEKNMEVKIDKSANLVTAL